MPHYQAHQRWGVSQVRLHARLHAPFPPTVSALLEERRQQAADHAATKEAVQESDHPGLQDAGSGTHQHGRGTDLPSFTPYRGYFVHCLFLA